MKAIGETAISQAGVLTRDHSDRVPSLGRVRYLVPDLEPRLLDFE